MTQKPLIFITNDDGVHAKGLSELVEVMQLFGDVVVVAPDTAMSGMSGAITTERPLRVHRITEQPGIAVYKCNGTPVDCVKIGFDHLVDRDPDFVVTGINHGANSSVSVHYSGTMGAAIEGCLHGVPSIGFSLLDFRADADFSKSKIFAARIFQEVMENGLPFNTCLNVNIPGGTPKGIKICRQANGRWTEEFDKRTDPRQRDYFWLSGSFLNMEEEAKDTDMYALEKNYVSIVPVKIDMTDYEMMKNLKNWKL